MSLKVDVIEASNVPNLESFGESDPQASVTYQGKQDIDVLYT